MKMTNYKLLKYLNNKKMKIKHITFIIISFFQLNLSAQVKDNTNFKKHTIHDLEYINEDGYNDLRLRKKGDKSFNMMAYVPFNSNDLLFTDTNYVKVNDKFRNIELIPNYKYYITDKLNVNFGMYITSSKTKYEGEVDTTISQQNFIGQTASSSNLGFFLRTGVEKHLALFRLDYFDLDFYTGLTSSFGIISNKDITNIDFDANEYSYEQYTTRNFGIGADLYTGINFQFDRFSLGAEVIIFGIDYETNSDRTKVEIDQNLNGSALSQTYYTSDLPGAIWSKYKSMSRQMNSYRGLRFTFNFYF